SYELDSAVAMRNFSRWSRPFSSPSITAPHRTARGQGANKFSVHSANSSAFGFRISFGLRISVFGLLLGLVFTCLATDHLQEIKTRGVLLWGADAEGGAPYVYPNPEKPEQLIGFECDLADALAAKLGVKAKMVQNQWDQLVP